MRTIVRLSLLVISLMTIASTAWACPRCQIGVKVRRTIFDGTFWANLGLLVLPIALAVMVTLIVYKAGQRHLPKRLRSKR